MQKQNLYYYYYYFCFAVVSVGNINLNYQTFILPLIVIIQWDFCLHKESDNSQCSTQRSDRIIIQSVLEWHEETEQTETKTRGTVGTSPKMLQETYLQRRNDFYTVQTVFSIALHQPTPKPTPYRETFCIFRFSKTSFCMIYKLVYSWDQHYSHKDKNIAICVWTFCSHIT